MLFRSRLLFAFNLIGFKFSRIDPINKLKELFGPPLFSERRLLPHATALMVAGVALIVI